MCLGKKIYKVVIIKKNKSKEIQKENEDLKVEITENPFLRIFL